MRLTVSDNGIGIPPGFLPHVFDRFSQKDSSISRSYGGLGLGLAITKQLIELHGGTVRVQSAGEGKGATFIVELPLTLLDTSDAIERRIHPRQGQRQQMARSRAWSECTRWLWTTKQKRVKSLSASWRSKEQR